MTDFHLTSALGKYFIILIFLSGSTNQPALKKATTLERQTLRAIKINYLECAK